VLGGKYGEEPATKSWSRLDFFVQAGGKFVETAHSYAEGRAERVIGDWIQSRDEEIIVIDKIGHPGKDGVPNLRAGQLLREAQESCSRLRTERIDVLLLHRDDPSLTVAEIADALLALLERQLAGTVGVSNWSPRRLESLLSRLAESGVTPSVSYQFSLAIPSRPLWPGTRNANSRIIEIVRKNSLVLHAWAAHAGGFFAKSPCPANTEESHPFFTSANFSRRDRCRELACEIGAHTEAVALAWLLHQPGVTASIGPQSQEELEISLSALRIALNTETLAWLSGANEDQS
jgi:aryl-alcohol dehydrogenase-like predicted oxidoreductase